MDTDVIVVGAGHNGLVAAGYLARAGLRVVMFERLPHVGGAAVTEELWPGFRFSTCAHTVHAIHPRIIRDLRLRERGLGRQQNCGGQSLGPRRGGNARTFGKLSQVERE